MQRLNICIFVCAALASLTAAASSAQLFTKSTRPTIKGEAARPLRYAPDGSDFVIHNGPLFFNRPLYGRPTQFRVDAGDKPEFLFYLPGRGGNLRLGIQADQNSIWLHNAENITARYRPGAMIYQIRDPLLGDDTTLKISAQSLYETEGLILRLELQAPSPAKPLTLITAYGGANGQRGARDGDLNTEDVSISQYFQLKPQYTTGNSFQIDGHRFTLQSDPATMVGTFPGASFSLADARHWASPTALLNSTGQPNDRPVVVGQLTLSPNSPTFLALQRTGKGGEDHHLDLPAPYSADQLPQIYADSEARRAEIASQVTVDTPDPFINAAVPALLHAAHGVWHGRTQSVAHGAVAWFAPLPGWRGAYAFDALGWHDKTRGHLDYWGQRQRTNNQYPTRGQPMEQFHLARSEPSLHSHGHIRASHYDMNLIYIDTLLRHLLWTGDTDYLKKMWPIIERSLAWEKRLFRREFARELSRNNLPLYEAYAAIWASDTVQYNGAGVACSSAYNYYHNKMVARLAEKLGKDPSPYRREARNIRDAMMSLLWLPHRGYMAEAKDILANQALYPAPALWTYYHTIDSEVVDPLTGYQMARYVDTQIPHIPIHGPDVPKGDFAVMSHSNWMPWHYSTNDVTMAEDMHTALADWQIGRRPNAFQIFKGHLLDSMFMGLCPGNLHMTSYFDAYRHEAQRDFADPIGITSRALVEGLFGIVPDALNNQFLIRPGFPASWSHASINHPNIAYNYQRNGSREQFTITPKFGQPMALRLKVRARRTQVAQVTVNGSPANWAVVEDAIGSPAIQISADPTEKFNVVIEWQGPSPASTTSFSFVPPQHQLHATFGNAEVLHIHDPQDVVSKTEPHRNGIRATISAESGHHTFFVRLRQGDLQWWAPINFEARPAIEILPLPAQDPYPPQDANHVRFMVRNNTDQQFAEFVTAKAGNTVSKKVELVVSPHGGVQPVTLPADGLLPGTIPITLQLPNGRRITGSVTNWKINAPETDWYHVSLSDRFNDQVDQIFDYGKYLSPRSPYTSLAMPTQGIGGWAGGFDTLPDIDDSGLRRVASQHNGTLTLPNGIPLQTPANAEANNIAFTSQWDNHPDKITIPLDGRASHIYLLMAGSTNPMKSRVDNGTVTVTYEDGTSEKLPLRNPTTWWPIQEDYMIDDYAFRRPGAIPPRVDLRTGNVRILDRRQFKGEGGPVDGGAATVLDLPLNPDKQLRSLSVRTHVYEVVIGLMGATLAR